MHGQGDRGTVAASLTCTLGPNTNSPEAWLDLAKAGATAFRIPFAKETPDEQFRKALAIRDLPQLDGVAVLADLPGTAPRTSNQEPIDVPAGSELTIGKDASTPAAVTIPMWDSIWPDLRHGMPVTFGDGEISGRLKEVHPTSATVSIEHATAPLQAKRRFSWPGWQRAARTLGALEHAFAQDSRSKAFTGVMLSYVDSAAPIRQFRNLLPNPPTSLTICAKIETSVAVAELTDIATEADAMLVGQGDLLLGCEPLQFISDIRRIAAWRATHPSPPIGIGTGLLEAFSTGELSRAELGYIAAMSELGFTSFMLAGETTIGAHPLECVRLLNRAVSGEKSADPDA